MKAECLLLYLLVCVNDVCKHTDHSTHVEIREQLFKVSSCSHLYVGPGDSTLVTRLVRQVPLSTEPSCQLPKVFLDKDNSVCQQ